MRAPLVEAKQDGSIRIHYLTKVVMARSCLGLAKERLVPFETAGNIPHTDDRPCAFHRISAVGLNVEWVTTQESIVRPVSYLSKSQVLGNADSNRILLIGARHHERQERRAEWRTVRRWVSGEGGDMWSGDEVGF